MGLNRGHLPAERVGKDCHCGVITGLLFAFRGQQKMESIVPL